MNIIVNQSINAMVLDLECFAILQSIINSNCTSPNKANERNWENSYKARWRMRRNVDDDELFTYLLVVLVAVVHLSITVAHLKSHSRELTLLDSRLERLRLLRLPFPVSECSDVNDSCEKSPLEKSLSMMMYRRDDAPPTRRLALRLNTGHRLIMLTNNKKKNSYLSQWYVLAERKWQAHM